MHKIIQPDVKGTIRESTNEISQEQREKSCCYLDPVFKKTCSKGYLNWGGRIESSS